MENISGQPAEYLEVLLDHLACPLDNTIPLSTVRNAAGKVTALKSGNAEYPVVRNVPCLIPKLEGSTKGDLPLWQGSQKKIWQEYQDGDKGIFTSEGNDTARHFGEIIAAVRMSLRSTYACPGPMSRTRSWIRSSSRTSA